MVNLYLCSEDQISFSSTMPGSQKKKKKKFSNTLYHSAMHLAHTFLTNSNIPGQDFIIIISVCISKSKLLLCYTSFIFLNYLLEYCSNVAYILLAWYNVSSEFAE